MNHVRHHHGSAHALTGTGVGAAGDLQRRAAGDTVDGRERPEELEPGPEPRDVVGGAGEQGPAGASSAPGTSRRSSRTFRRSAAPAARDDGRRRSRCPAGASAA